jgi:tetratricopeptide (TPR) repeat protein
VVLACLVTGIAHAEESSKVEVPQTQNPYIRAVATLYEQAKYEEALTRLEKALEWKSNGPQEVLWLKLMQGVLQAELAPGAALESFKQALAMDELAQLPVKGSRRLRKLFEQARSTLALPADEDLLAQEWEQSRSAPGAAAGSGPPPRRYGMSVGVRGEVDVLGLAVTNAVTPSVSLGYTREKLGGAMTVVIQPSPALRAEGQWHPLTLGWVRPYARLGATAFFRELDAQGEPSFFGGASGRVALGLDVQWTSRLSAFADVAYERFFTGGERYKSQSVLISVGVGLFP